MLFTKYYYARTVIFNFIMQLHSLTRYLSSEDLALGEGGIVMRRPGGTSDSSTVLGRKLTSASPFVIVHPHVCTLAKNYCYPRT